MSTTSPNQTEEIQQLQVELNNYKLIHQANNQSLAKLDLNTKLLQKKLEDMEKEKEELMEKNGEMKKQLEATELKLNEVEGKLERMELRKEHYKEKAERHFDKMNTSNEESEKDATITDLTKKVLEANMNTEMFKAKAFMMATGMNSTAKDLEQVREQLYAKMWEIEEKDVTLQEKTRLLNEARDLYEEQWKHNKTQPKLSSHRLKEIIAEKLRMRSVQFAVPSQLRAFTPRGNHDQMMENLENIRSGIENFDRSLTQRKQLKFQLVIEDEQIRVERMDQTPTDSEGEYEKIRHTQQKKKERRRSSSVGNMQVDKKPRGSKDFRKLL